MEQENEHPIIFFDGVCNFCNAWVNFIIGKDKKDIFRFTPLQSAYTQENHPEFILQNELPKTFILLSEGNLFKRSDAVLEICRLLGGPWKIIAGFKIIPKFLRDAAYSLVAKNRYKIFGKRRSCMVPGQKVKEKFL